MPRNKMSHCVVFVALSVVSVSSALADFKNLLNWIPGEANALVVIDIEKIMNSPLAAREGWKEKRANAYADRPLIVPPEANLLVMAALVDLSSMTPLWELSVMDLSKPPSLAAIARAEGGYVDKFAEKAAARSPINAYFVQLDRLVLGAVAPANRQFTARWASRRSTLGNAAASPYLRQVARTVGPAAHITIAMDLEGATSEAKARKRLESETFSSLAGAKIDIDALSQVLGSVRGVTLRVKIGNQASGSGVIEFSRETLILASVAKPLLMELLSKAGVQIVDFDGWDFGVKGKTITFEGQLSTNGLQRIFSLVDPPTPLQSQNDDVAVDTQPDNEGENATATVSKKYFRTVDRIIANLQRRMGTGRKAASLADSATWTERDARRIERLPILNVDPDLLNWGAEVATALRDVAQVFKVGGLQTIARTSGLTVGGVHVSYDSYSGYADSAGRSNIRYTVGQRRQAAFEEKAAATQAAGEIAAALRGSLSRIRMEMTRRYQIEF